MWICDRSCKVRENPKTGRLRVMDHLFVYGTLLSKAQDTLGAVMRARLARETASQWQATSPGRLFTLGDYPGMIPAEPRDRNLVTGEVFALRDAEATFRWLDLYEDVDQQNPARGIYRRVPHLALMADGGTLRCWVYALNAEPPAGVVSIEPRRVLPSHTS